MLISEMVVDKIGILTDCYTHGLADIEYTTKAKNAGISPNINSYYLREFANEFNPDTIKKNRYGG